MNTTSTGERDYLAIILVGAGSSYARGPDKQDTIARVQRIAVSDWGSIYDLAGKQATVNVFDVTGYDKVWWDTRGVHVCDDPANDPELPNEQIEVTLPSRRKR